MLAASLAPLTAKTDRGDKDRRLDGSVTRVVVVTRTTEISCDDSHWNFVYLLITTHIVKIQLW